MNWKRNSLVGRDGEAIGYLAGVMIVIAIIVWILSMIAMVVVGIAAAIGAWYSLKNYVISFKENVIDSNRNAPILIEE